MRSSPDDNNCRLTNVTEQLKKKSVKSVIGLLNSVTRRIDVDPAIDLKRMNNLLSQWHEIDIQITEAANEAKDNLKYLSTLERFIPPLNSSDPTSVIEVLPALLNAVKMVYTISRYFNTSERVTKLFMKIANQLIEVCKRCIIYGETSDSIWNRPIPALLQSFEKCFLLNEAYRDNYLRVKEKLQELPESKQFDFPDMQIIGKFDLFCQRITKLMDLFSTVQQFKNLAQHKFENIDALLAEFHTMITLFRGKGRDLLDYHHNGFDRDFVDFNEQLLMIEKHLQAYINKSFETAGTIEKSLTLLVKYQNILHRDTLRHDLDSKLAVIFQNYGVELVHVQEMYERDKNHPPLPRNIPPVAGNISWARHLLRKIESPMKRFEPHLSLVSTKDSKRIVKLYNKLAKTLLAFEYLWFEAWTNSIENAKAGLQATIIIRKPETGKFYVNFDVEIFQLIQESKCLVKLGIDIPDSAKLIMLQEDKYKAYYNDLKYLLVEYNRVHHKIAPIIKPLFEPHLQAMEVSLRPGLVTLTWTSLNIDQYKTSIANGLSRLDELVSKINDIIENRIQKNLRMISKTILVSLPSERAVTVEEFVVMQETAVKNATNFFAMKNIEIENAVYDIFDILTAPNAMPLLDEERGVSIPMISKEVLNEVHQHFENLTYQSLLSSIKTSLNVIKKRAHSRSHFDTHVMKMRPFFEVDVQLSVSNVRLSPSLIDIQRAINRSTVAILGCAKKIYAWDIRGRNIYLQQPEHERVAFFDKIGQDTEIVKTVLLLTGAIGGVRKQVHETIAIYDKYNWLWKDDKELAYRRFISRNPSIEDFEHELKKFLFLEEEISALHSQHNVGVLALNTGNLKVQLCNESRYWKILYSQKVYMFAKEALNGLSEYMRVVSNKLNIPVQSLDNLGYVMSVLKEIREKESSINIEVAPILDMYSMLERYLPDGMIEKEEMDKKASIYSSWRKVVEQAENVTSNLSAVQGKYKAELIKDIREFGIDVRNFRKVFEESGPLVAGIKPLVAIERLKKFKDELALRERRLEMIRSGETLFAFRHTKFLEIPKTKKEINFVDTLYTLYTDVSNSLKTWNGILWSNITEQIPMIQETVQSYDSRCKKLARKLREWIAYDEISQKINDIMLLLPLIASMSKPSIKPRHWQEINQLISNIPSSPRFPTPKPFRFNDTDFRLSQIILSGIVKFKDEVEEICDGADKQLQIEKKLNDLKDYWQYAVFEFMSWKNRDTMVLKSHGSILEDLEESQQQLQTLLTIRYVAPFREELMRLLSQLSDTSDTLELWIKVQMQWTSLESVFLGGDIAKQMPMEAKKFLKVNKDWEKIMSRAFEAKTVVSCCNNELLRTTLPVIYLELEKCQKSLEGYLEQKRSKFPRFYFVSNPALLLILSQGSDPQQMQPYYEKVFDSIDHVTHSKSDSSSIVEIASTMGGQKEVVPLASAVKANGNIEDWLGELELEMQRSLKQLCEVISMECLMMPMRTFVNKACGQFALLGLQIWWTSHCSDAITKSKTNKHIMGDTVKLINTILSDLSAWCLEDLGSAINRVKIETLITIQVHQRDVFIELNRLHKERKLVDVNDFEWLRQIRFSWQSQSTDRHGNGACIISICDVDYKYSFEYLGCKERLVITPLTDRCFIAMSQAMGMGLGTSHNGPTGTGKTETVKDLGRAVGVFVVVTNCTDQQRYSDMARIFKGLCQAGLWVSTASYSCLLYIFDGQP
jgi:dynein heavy chain, axonemal